MKICANKKCHHEGKQQPLDNFYNRVRNSDGLETRCKDCIQATIRRNQIKLGRQEKHSHDFETILIGKTPKYYWL